MNIKTMTNQKGIGLLEVLIAVLIVAVGLIILAKLQGSLLQSSGDTKARSEAMQLAQQKIEELRESMELENASDTGFTDNPDLLVSGNTHSSPPVTGTNATFNVQWVVTDITAFAGAASPPRKAIDVNVSWTASTGEVQNVFAATELIWEDPAKSLLYSDNGDAGTAAVPSPRQNASADVPSESVVDSTVDGGGDSELDASGTIGDATLTLPTIADANDQTINDTNVQLKQIAAGSHYYATDDDSLFFVDPGVIAVFVCDGNPVKCKYIQNHFGGVPLRTAGMVYSASVNGLTDINVAWTSSDVNACWQGPIVPNVIAGVDGMQYECVYAGNCEDVPSADRDGIGVFTNGNGCSTNVSTSEIQSRNVGPGGEFGDIGILGVDDQGGDREQVCFLEDTADATTSTNILLYNAASGRQYKAEYLLPVTKRFYVSRRMNATGIESSEGINKSYTDHNFLIIDRANGNSVNDACNDHVVDSGKGEKLAFREVIRVMDGDNVVGPPPWQYTGSVAKSLTLSGSINATANNVRFYISEGGTCYVNTATSATYACAIPRPVASTTVTIRAASDDIPASDNNYHTCTVPITVAAGVYTYTPCAWPGDFSDPSP